MCAESTPTPSLWLLGGPWEVSCPPSQPPASRQPASTGFCCGQDAGEGMAQPMLKQKASMALISADLGRTRGSCLEHAPARLREVVVAALQAWSPLCSAV